MVDRARRSEQALRRCDALLVAALVTFAAAPARANGRFPAAGQIALVGAGDAKIAVRTTFGLVVSEAASGTWGWVCEPAIGYSGQEDPSIAWTSDVSLTAALSEGLAVSDDAGCAFRLAIGGESFADVATASGRAVAVSRAGARAAAIYASSDGGTTWTRSGSLPAGFVPETIELSRSDPERVYVSGAFVSPTQKAALFVSTDGGETLVERDIATDTASDVPYVSAVDPVNPSRLYVRIDGKNEDLLVVSGDAGASFETLFVAPAPLLGFALSPDGHELAVGGKDLGVWTGPSGSQALTKVSNVGARCLAWSEKGIYACGDEARDGFTIGLSTDGGRSFVPAFHLAQLCGPLACDPSSPTTTQCSSLWPVQRDVLGISACGAPASSSAASSSSGDPGSVSGDGCICAASTRGTARPGFALLAALAGVLALRRAPRRRADAMR